MGLGEAIFDTIWRAAWEGLRGPCYAPFDLPKKPKKRKGGPQDRASYWRSRLRKELPG